MPSATAATPGVYSHQIAAGQRCAAHGLARRDRQQLQARADGRHRAARRASTRCSAASGQPSPPANRGTSSRAGKQRNPGQQVIRHRRAEKAERDRRRQQAACGPGEEGARGELHRARSSFRRTSPAHRVDALGGPADLGELRIEHQRIAIVMHDHRRRVAERPDQREDRDQRLGRRQPAHVDVHTIGVAPAPAARNAGSRTGAGRSARSSTPSWVRLQPDASASIRTSWARPQPDASTSARTSSRTSRCASVLATWRR